MVAVFILLSVFIFLAGIALGCYITILCDITYAKDEMQIADVPDYYSEKD